MLNVVAICSTHSPAQVMTIGETFQQRPTNVGELLVDATHDTIATATCSPVSLCALALQAFAHSMHAVFGWLFMCSHSHKSPLVCCVSMFMLVLTLILTSSSVFM